jgi:acetyltransferase-like isoleucine patch superfamily enzyme
MFGIFRSIWFLFRHLSLVHPTVRFGKKLKFGYFNIINKSVVVGDNVNIQNFILLKEGTTIGTNCYIDSYCRSSGDNNIGNGVTLRFGSTIARKVTIGDNVFIAPNVMTVYSLPDGSKSRGTIIEKDSFVGTAAVISPNIRISEGTVIGTNSFVNKDCKEKGVYVGNPARLIRRLS